jgi:hypothetical protein
VLALCGLLTAVPAARASAEWQFAPFVGFNFLGDTNLNLTQTVGRHWNFGGAVRLVGAGPLGVESVFLYVPGYFESLDLECDPLVFNTNECSNAITKSRTFALMGNIVLTTPRSWNEYGLRPFVSGGFGLLHAFHNDVFSPARANLPGYNVGGGAVGFLTDRVGLRFDLRYFRTLPPGVESAPLHETPDNLERVHLRYWTGTVGVVFKY